MCSSDLIAHGIRMMLPYSERIAVRAFLVALGSLATLAVGIVAMAAGAFGSPPVFRSVVLLASVAVVFLASFVGFVVLFPGFAQASAVAMKGIGAEGTD